MGKRTTNAEFMQAVLGNVEYVPVHGEGLCDHCAEPFTRKDEPLGDPRWTGKLCEPCYDKHRYGN